MNQDDLQHNVEINAREIERLYRIIQLALTDSEQALTELDKFRPNLPVVSSDAT